MISPVRWVWALREAFLDMLRATGRLMLTRWALVFAVLALAIIAAQVFPK